MFQARKIWPVKKIRDLSDMASCDQPTNQESSETAVNESIAAKVQQPEQWKKRLPWLFSVFFGDDVHYPVV